MKAKAFILVFLCLILGAAMLVQVPLRTRTVPTLEQEATAPRVVEAYGKLPLSFEANQGQTDPQVKFLSRGGGYTLFLTPTEAVLALRTSASGTSPHKQGPKAALAGTSPYASNQERTRALAPEEHTNVLRMQLVGANPESLVAGLGELPGKSNYFIGNDPKKWRTNVLHYRKVAYREVYPGIDLVYYGTNQRQLEYDFIVAPGADPKAIKLNFEGADELEIDSRGNLVLRLADGELRFRKPYVYQEVDGVQQELAGGYALLGSTKVGIELASYDVSKPLIIDPILEYSTYLGGSGNEFGLGIDVDYSGNTYVIGDTASSNFPTANPLDSTFGGGSPHGDAFIAKLNLAGELVYATYLGGNANDSGLGIAVDATGSPCVAGFTASTDFPMEKPFQAIFGGGPFDVFVAKLNADGSALAYSTYLGGSGDDEVRDSGFALGPSGNCYVTGFTNSINFPTTVDAFDTSFNGGGFDVFVARLNPDAAFGADSLIYSTYLGGDADDQGRGIDVDAFDNAYVTGTTTSTNFPLVNAFDTSFNGGTFDAFVTKLNSSGTAPLLYSTYLGSTDRDVGLSIAVDDSGNIYVTGDTTSTNFPTTPDVFDGSHNGGLDVFVAKMNPAASGLASLVYSTYLGGSGEDQGASIAVDDSGNTYVTGFVSSPNFPTTADAFQAALKGFSDAFLTKLNSTGTAPLLYSTYFGGNSDDAGRGVAVDAAGNTYVTGWTASADFPTANPFQPATSGGVDAFVAKFSFVVEVLIDIKPGSFPNSINLGSGGTVPVAIFSTPTFDATTVDPTSVTLASAPVKLKGKGTPMASFEDVNADGLLDLVVHVSTQALELSETDTEAVLEGQTFDGLPFRGVDTIRVVP